MKKYLPWFVLITSFLFYLVLCSKQWTWLFVSGDSGDWLAASVAWMNAQTYGSPLYILLGRGISLMPGSLPLNMTILLSVVPAAFTVLFVYLIVLKVTSKQAIALVSSLVLLGSTILLTQSTVLEEYAISVMCLTSAYWFYINDKRKLTALFLGLGTAIHIFFVPIMFFWLLCDRRWKYWCGWPVWVYIASGILPYTLILILMAADTPKFLAGYLSWESLVNYWTMTSRAIIGQLSLFEAPERLWLFVRLISMSFGLALLPIIVAVRKPVTRNVLVLISISLFTFWYFITCLDVNAWTFMSFATPSLVILCGIGLSRVKQWHTVVVTSSAIMLIITNSIFLNANVLVKQTPEATSYETELKALPQGSVVVVTPGVYSMGLFYVINQGNELIPLVYPYLDKWAFKDYGVYLERKYGVSWSDTLEGVKKSLEEGKQVYFFQEGKNTPIEQCFILNGREIVNLTGLQPEEDFLRIK